MTPASTEPIPGAAHGPHFVLSLLQLQRVTYWKSLHPPHRRMVIAGVAGGERGMGSDLLVLPPAPARFSSDSSFIILHSTPPRLSSSSRWKESVFPTEWAETMPYCLK